MKKLLIFATIITNSLFASTITLETLNKQEFIDILIKNDIIVEREARQSREVPESRIVCMERNSRDIRENRVVRMGRNSRNIRLERVVQMIHEIQEKKENSQKIISLI